MLDSLHQPFDWVIGNHVRVTAPVVAPPAYQPEYDWLTCNGVDVSPWFDFPLVSVGDDGDDPQDVLIDAEATAEETQQYATDHERAYRLMRETYLSLAPFVTGADQAQGDAEVVLRQITGIEDFSIDDSARPMLLLATKIKLLDRVCAVMGLNDDQRQRLEQMVFKPRRDHA